MTFVRELAFIMPQSRCAFKFDWSGGEREVVLLAQGKRLARVGGEMLARQQPASEPLALADD